MTTPESKDLMQRLWGHSRPLGHGPKFFGIALLTFLLLLPTAFIQDVVRDRQNYQNDARQEIRRIAGGPVEIQGLVISVPYHLPRPDTTQPARHTRLLLLPKRAELTGVATTDFRHKGIYRMPVVQGEWSLSGSFLIDGWDKLGIDPGRIDWEGARMHLCLSQVQALRGAPRLHWQGRALDPEPGSRAIPQLRVATEALIPVTQEAMERGVDFEAHFELGGSESLGFLPLGGETRVQLRSDWKHPSFTGSHLARHEIRADSGFTAAWSVSRFNSGIPQAWLEDATPHSALTTNGFGVELHEPVDRYLMATRAVKYALLFLALTFSAFFLFEVLAGVRLHGIQYLFAGAALCLFYLLLLSLSEHLPFTWAYGLSAAGVVTSVTLYGKAVLGRLRLAAILSALLATLYGYLYILLQAETMSLLFGSVGLFILLSLVMYLTRKVDWYRAGPMAKGGVA